MIPTLLIQHDNLNPDQDQAIADTLQKIKDQVRLLLYFFIMLFLSLSFFFLHLICSISSLPLPSPLFHFLPPSFLPSFLPSRSLSLTLFLLLIHSPTSSPFYSYSLFFLLFFLTPPRHHLFPSPFTPGTNNAYTLITFRFFSLISSLYSLPFTSYFLTLSLITPSSSFRSSPPHLSPHSSLPSYLLPHLVLPLFFSLISSCSSFLTLSFSLIFSPSSHLPLLLHLSY